VRVKSEQGNVEMGVSGIAMGKVSCASSVGEAFFSFFAFLLESGYVCSLWHISYWHGWLVVIPFSSAILVQRNKSSIPIILPAAKKKRQSFELPFI